MTELECCEYYHKTGKIPPLTLHTWAMVYSLLVGAGYGKV